MKTEVEVIRQLRQASNDAIAKKDLDGVAASWADDFVITRGNGTSATGKAEVMAAWKKIFDSTPEVSFVRTPSEIVVSERDADMAWETGTWQGINTYAKGGNYSAMWRRKNGQWKIQAELFVALK